MHLREIISNTGLLIHGSSGCISPKDHMVLRMYMVLRLLHMVLRLLHMVLRLYMVLLLLHMVLRLYGPHTVGQLFNNLLLLYQYHLHCFLSVINICIHRYLHNVYEYTTFTYVFSYTQNYIYTSNIICDPHDPYVRIIHM